MDPKPAAGIDYNLSRLDVAVVGPRGRRMLNYQSFDLGKDVRGMVRAISRCVESLVDAGVGIVVMEKPWMREGRGLGAAMNLHKVPTRVETLAVYAGLSVRFIPVNSWHAQVLGKGNISSADGKVASIRYAQSVFGWRAPNADAADAVCLATWGAVQLSLEALST